MPRRSAGHPCPLSEKVYTLLHTGQPRNMSVPRTRVRPARQAVIQGIGPVSRGRRAEPRPSGATTRRIVDAIVEAIALRRLRPGTRLTESQIGEMFDVSRTVVRQALNQLSRDRLITLEPGRGARVAEPTVAEAREVFEARAILETAIASRLARQITKDQIARLRNHLAAERASLAGGDASQRTWLLGDFHGVLAVMLGNRTLTDMLAELLSRSSLIALMYQSRESAEHSHAEHVAIVDALEAGDARLVQRLVRSHLTHVENKLRLEPAGGDLRSALMPSDN